MEPLLRTLVGELERGEPSLGALAALGEPEPERAAAALREAAGHPDLRANCAHWLPGLLLSARPGFAARSLCELADRYRQACGSALDLETRPALPRLLGSSDFLARLLLRHPSWCEELSGDPPPAPPEVEPEPDWTAIRIAKYRGLLRIAARDLLERDFEESLGELSRLADACLRAALQAAARQQGQPPPALLALGKLGGQELNFSSDVDLLFVYDPVDGDPRGEAAYGLSQLIQTFKQNLEAPSEDGFGYRVDLDLRPEGRQGVLVNSVDAALSYYETFGADWERQALIRLRPLCGAPGVGESFSRQLRPFVFPAGIDPGAIRAVHAMKLRIEAERRTAGRDVEVDLKEGPGGIRDVEFLVQALQMISGGRHAALRTGNVPAALEALRNHALLPDAVAGALRGAYAWLRRAEHSLQMVEERQTHRFPRDETAQRALARRMGYRDPEGDHARNRLLDDWTSVRSEVRSHFDALVLEVEE